MSPPNSYCSPTGEPYRNGASSAKAKMQQPVRNWVPHVPADLWRWRVSGWLPVPSLSVLNNGGDNFRYSLKIWSLATLQLFGDKKLFGDAKGMEKWQCFSCGKKPAPWAVCSWLLTITSSVAQSRVGLEITSSTSKRKTLLPCWNPFLRCFPGGTTAAPSPEPQMSGTWLQIS